MSNAKISYLNRNLVVEIMKLQFNHLFIVILISSIFFLVFYPKFYTTTDEKEYIENAFHLLQGDLLRSNKECFDGAYCGVFNGTAYVSKYNLGLSFILLPFILISWKLTFAAAFISYLIGIWIFYLILKKYKLSPWFVYLYAFFPSLVYYSVKPMTEVFSSTLILALYYILFLMNSSKTARLSITGILSGVLVLIRYSNGLVVAAFLIAYILTSIKHNHESVKKVAVDLLEIFVSSVPFIIAFLIINKTLYGSFFRSGYFYSGEEGLFIADLAVKQFFIYIAYLNLIYPAMLFMAFISKIKERLAIILAFAFILLFYVGFPGYAFTSGILDLIFGIRFFLPIIGLLILLYADSLTFAYRKFFAKKIDKRIFLVLIVVLITLAAGIRYTYFKRVEDLYNQSTQIYSQYSSTGKFSSTDIEQRKLVNDAFNHGTIWFYPTR